MNDGKTVDFAYTWPRREHFSTLLLADYIRKSEREREKTTFSCVMFTFAAIIFFFSMLLFSN
jgi:hypothetical protein